MRFSTECFGRCQSVWSRKTKVCRVSIDANESLRIFLAQQLEDVEQDIEMISSYISENPPETTGELLKLRELQRKYREIAGSLKNEIVKLGST
jgi:hypothetical protein